PAVNARAMLLLQDSPNVSATTDADGRFQWQHLAPGKARLLVSPPPDVEYLRKSVTLEIGDTGKDEEQTIRLSKGTTISGVVVDGETGKGISGVSLTVRDPEASGQLTSSAGSTQADGSFRLIVPPGKVAVEIV